MLLALFFCYYFSKKNLREMDFFLLSFFASLIVLNRYDEILLIAPCYGLCFLQRQHYAADFKDFLTGFLPLWVWLGFSWFYYGSILPDTYYAKVMTGVPFSDSIHTAIMHHLRLLDLDPVGGFMMLFVCILTIYFLLKRLRPKPLYSEKYFTLIIIGAGILLYNIYFFYVGGDYMTGRFSSAPIFLSTFFILLFLKGIAKKSVTLTAIVFFFILMIIKLCGITVFVPKNSASSPDGVVRALTFDMKRFQQNWYFLGQDHGAKDWRALGLSRAVEADNSSFSLISVNGSAGVISYYAGPKNRFLNSTNKCNSRPAGLG